MHHVRLLEANDGVAPGVGRRVGAQRDRLVADRFRPGVFERLRRVRLCVGFSLVGGLSHQGGDVGVGDDAVGVLRKDPVAAGVVAVVMRVDDEVEGLIGAIPEAAPARGRRLGRLRVHHDQGTVPDEPADGATPASEGTHAAPEGREAVGQRARGEEGGGHRGGCQGRAEVLEEAASRKHKLITFCDELRAYG